MIRERKLHMIGPRTAAGVGVQFIAGAIGAPLALWWEGYRLLGLVTLVGGVVRDRLGDGGLSGIAMVGGMTATFLVGLLVLVLVPFVLSGLIVRGVESVGRNS